MDITTNAVANQRGLTPKGDNEGGHDIPLCCTGRPVNATRPCPPAFDRHQVLIRGSRSSSGYASGVRQLDGEQYAVAPMGQVRFAMAAENAYRVLDHDVTLPDERVITNAFRVTPAAYGCRRTVW
jgi:hypothetical protein